MDQIEAIVREVLSRLQQEPKACSDKLIPAEMSARHVHLSPEDLKALFGKDRMEVVRNLSQPGQFLSDCRVRLIGPKGILEQVAVLGPARGATQVELSASDARHLGISAPVRLSGELADAAEIALQVDSAIIVRKAAIIAKRHLHMTPSDAAAFGVSAGQIASVRVMGTRPLILEDVPIRISETAGLALHVDTDEANAAGLGKAGKCQIVSLCSGSDAACSNGTLPCSKGENPGKKAPAGALTQAQACSTLPGKLITEYDIKQLSASGAKALCVAREQIITPLARDTAKACGISLTFGG